MLNLKHIKFQDKKIEDITYIRGTLLLHSQYSFDSIKQNSCLFSLRDYAEERIRRDIWYHVYGELIKAIPPLQMFSCMSNIAYKEEVTALNKTVDNLLAFPKN